MNPLTQTNERVEKLEQSVEGIAEDVKRLKDLVDYDFPTTAPVIDIIPSTIPAEEQPLPCPFCGGETEVWYSRDKYHVWCVGDCGAAGPDCFYCRYAIDGWNQMVRAMDAAKKPAPAAPVAEPEQWTSGIDLLESDGSRGCEWVSNNVRFMERGSGPRREFRLDVNNQGEWFHGPYAAEAIADAINAAYQDGVTAGKKEAEAKPAQNPTNPVETPAQKIALNWTVDGKGFGIDANTPGKEWVRDHIEIVVGNAPGVRQEWMLRVDGALHDYIAAGAIARAIDDIAKAEYERGKKEAVPTPTVPATWKQLDTHEDKKSVGWDWVNSNVRLMSKGDVSRIEVRGELLGGMEWWVDCRIPIEIANAIDNAVADEREACAKIAETRNSPGINSLWGGRIASTIRSRSKDGAK